MTTRFTSSRPDDRRGEERAYEGSRSQRGSYEYGYGGDSGLRSEQRASRYESEVQPSWSRGSERRPGWRDEPYAGQEYGYGGYGRGRQGFESWRENPRGEEQPSYATRFEGDRPRQGWPSTWREPQRNPYASSDYEGEWQRHGYSSSYGPGGGYERGGYEPSRYEPYRERLGSGTGGATGGRYWEGSVREREGDLGFAGRGPKGFKRSDERVREAVSERLEEADDVDASDVAVDVSQGEVTLTGSVASRWMKRRAEDCIADLPGVKDVSNQLRVQPKEARTDREKASGEKSGERSSAAGQHSRTTSRSSV
jgi:hypothetical protein